MANSRHTEWFKPHRSANYPKNRKLPENRTNTDTAHTHTLLPPPRGGVGQLFHHQIRNLSQCAFVNRLNLLLLAGFRAIDTKYFSGKRFFPWLFLSRTDHLEDHWPRPGSVPPHIPQWSLQRPYIGPKSHTHAHSHHTYRKVETFWIFNSFAPPPLVCLYVRVHARVCVPVCVQLSLPFSLIINTKITLGNVKNVRWCARYKNSKETKGSQPTDGRHRDRNLARINRLFRRRTDGRGESAQDGGLSTGLCRALIPPHNWKSFRNHVVMRIFPRRMRIFGPPPPSVRKSGMEYVG